jgi:2-oxoisovalerate ferredoxin oxidoreductase beta subunit
MAELIAQLDGPVYVERVALYDRRERVRAKKAIRKAVALQVERRGFAFVEVLAECPVHLHLTPVEAERWVREQMVPVFPLGVKKDLAPAPWFELPRPIFEPAALLAAVGGTAVAVPPEPAAFPAHLDPEDVSLKLAGAGGDGAQTAALLIAKAAIEQGFDATHIPSYGPESRGGTSYADVHVARGEVLSPASPEPHVLLAFNAPSLLKFGPTVRRGGTVLYDSSVVADAPCLGPGIRRLAVPLTEIATDLGRPMVKNVVALGALADATHLLPPEAFLAALRRTLKSDCALAALNEEAFARGRQHVDRHPA